jgi:capsular polysaccharide biosynthesis protein
MIVCIQIIKPTIMQNISYSKSIQKNWEIVALITGIAVVATLVIAVVSPFQYQATSKVLIIQNQLANLDAYTSTKSAEKIGQNLSEVVSSTTFYNEVIKANPRVAMEFSSDEVQRRKEWKKDVEASIVPETGILEISAYNTDKRISAEMAQTVTAVLISKGREYHGGGDTVTMQIIDDVYVGKYPVRPNLPLNLAFALVLGLVAGSVFVVLQEAREAKNRYQQKNIFEVTVPEDIAEPTREIKGLSFQPMTRELEPAMARNWRIIEEE